MRNIAGDKPKPPHPADENLRLARSGGSSGEGQSIDEQLQKFLKGLQKKEGKDIQPGEALDPTKETMKANIHKADMDIWKILKEAHERHQRKYSGDKS